MSYRIKEHHHHHGHRTMADVASPMLISVHNGATAHLAIPCWYQEIQKPVRARHHNIHWHHHVGWPSPNHPDHICQIAYEGRHYGHKCPIGKDHCEQTCSHYIDMSQISPIHLLSEYEGYESASVYFDEKIDGLSATAWIDAWEDWVVRVSFSPLVDEAIDHPVNCHFSVFVNGKKISDTRWTDASSDSKITREFPARRDVVAHGILRILPSAYKELQ